MLARLYVVAVVALVAFGCGKSEPSQAEQAHEQRRGRAAEIAKAGQDKWLALADEVLAGTVDPSQQDAALTAIDGAKTRYLADVKPLREEVAKLEPSVRGEVSSALNRFQESDAYKQKVKQLQERAQSFGHDHREVGEAIRALTNYEFVYGVVAER